MTWLLTGPGKAAGAILVLLAVLGGVWAVAYERGRLAERQAILAHTIQVMKDRQETNEKVRKFDDVGLCRTLGGVWDNEAGCQ